MSHKKEEVIEAHFRFCSRGLFRFCLKGQGQESKKMLEVHSQMPKGMDGSAEQSSKEHLIEKC